MAEQLNGLYWHGCYKSMRKGKFFTPASISHPAKMSGALLDRLRRFMEERGWLNEGDTVLDNYFGIGTTGLLRLYGYDVIGVELEPKFVAMAEENAELLARRAGGQVRRLGDCRIVQGDSRELGKLLGVEVDSLVTSPPYSGQNRRDIAKEPYGQQLTGGLKRNIPQTQPYGEAEGQIGNLPDQPDAAVTSPPYADSIKKGGNPWRGKSEEVLRSWWESYRRSGGGMSFEGYVGHYQQGVEYDYGSHEGQIAELLYAPDAAVTSPPYEGVMTGRENHEARAARTGGFTQGMKDTIYGESPNTFLSLDPSGLSNEERQQLAAQTSNIGSLSNKETYQSAMLKCYQELFSVLKPGGVACVVTKNPTRSGALRRLDLDTAALLLQAGFALWCPVCEQWDRGIHDHSDPDHGIAPIVGYRAVLWEELEQPTLFGEVEKKAKGRLSFFKRLMYRKGQPVAMWEDVIFARVG